MASDSYEVVPEGDALDDVMTTAPKKALTLNGFAAAAPAMPNWRFPSYGERYQYNGKLSVTYSSPQGKSGTVTFTVTNLGGAVVRTYKTGQVASGSPATVDMATNALPSGWYHVVAKASDGTSTATSPRNFFEISTSTSATPGLGVKPFYSFEDVTLADRAQMSVNLANGNLVLRSKDVAIRGSAGHDLTLERVYNSQQATVRGPGKGWSMGPAQQAGLYFAKGNLGRDIVYEDEAQTRWLFAYNATTKTWKAPAGLNARLVATQLGFDLIFNSSKRRIIFDDAGRIEMIRDRSGNGIDIKYDALSQLMHTIVDSQQRATTLKHDATRRLTSVTDPSGRTATYTASGTNLTSAKDLSGNTWAYEYASKLTKVTDPRGNQTRIAYTSDGSKVASIVRVTNTTTGAGPTTKFTYHAAGGCPKTEITTACTVVTDANGKATTSGYDSQGRVTKVYDALGKKRTSAYDTLGNVISLSSNGNGTTTPTTKTAYVAGTYKVSSMETTEGGKATFSYGDPSVESPTKYTTPQGTSLNYTYRSGDGNLASIKTASGGEDRYRLSYNANGTLSSYSQPNLTTSGTTDRVATNLSYTNGNLTKLDLPAPLGDMTFTVDGYGRRTSQTDGKGKVTRYTYDGLDRLTRITFAGGATIVYGYDGNGNQTSRTVTEAGSTAKTTYAYDALNRVVSEVKPNGARVDLSYDGVGNLRTFKAPTGTTSYEYNPVNLLSKVIEPGGAATTYGYDSDNNRTRVSYPNGVVVTSTYNGANAVKSIKAAKGTSIHVDLKYSYDKDNNGTDDMPLRSKVVDGLKKQSTAYSYESEYSQLARAHVTSSSGSTVKNYAYKYDVNGNRTSSTEDSTTRSFTYNAAGQLTKAGSGTYSYDANGNQLTGGGVTAAYNDRDQTTTINGAGVKYEDKDQAQRASLGSRTFHNTPLGVTSYTDPDAKVTSVIRESTGQLTAVRQPTGATSYPVTDALGSVVALTSSTGAKTDTFTYDPYGQNAGRTGTTPNPFQFTGEYRDPSGLDKIGMRYYQPSAGRWTQIDPLRRATNPSNPPEATPYAYVGNNPVNYTDPLGLYSWEKFEQHFAANLAGAVVGTTVGLTCQAAVIGLAAPTAGGSLVVSPGCAVAGFTAGAVIGGVVGDNIA